MAQKKNTKSSTKSNSHPEVKGLIIIAWSILLLLSLISFSDGDALGNWLGYLGYSIAWLCNYLFGLGSYVLCYIILHLGWKKLCRQTIQQPIVKGIYSFLLLFSLCILLTTLAEGFPSAAKKLGQFVYGESVTVASPTPYKIHRYYLGGVPAYYLYLDIPVFNLHRLLSSVGVSLVFFTIFITSLLLLLQISVAPLLQMIQKGIEKTANRDNRDAFVAFIKNLCKRKESAERYTASSSLRAQALGTKSILRPKRHMPEPISANIALLNPRLGSKIPEEPKISIPQPSPKLIDFTEEKPLTAVDKRQKALTAQTIYNGNFENYTPPSPALLTDPKIINHPSLKRDLRKQAEILEETLLSFGIEAKVGEIHCGPTITSFEVHPAVGVKVQRIKALESDIALNMEAKSIRIIAPIPGKAAVGIEVPTASPQEVNFKEMLIDYQKRNINYPIPILLGKTVSGGNVIVDLAKMPHCIIAGATGTGKSVCINAFVISILMNCKPDEVKLILVDPKKVELSPYSNLPHMLAPVITEPQGVIAALKWLVKEMETRYELLKQIGVRNIESFNKRSINQELEESLDIEVPKHMSYIVCIIDELADLMMMSSNEIEMPIARIAQMARAVGIHLVLATQRPSREVITGLIKANFPTRISFKVASRVNSQIVLDEIGAEALLGNGDMLFHPPASSNLVRTQGCFIRDQDIHKVIETICEQAPPNYLIDSFDSMGKEGDCFDNSKADPIDLDPLYEQALELVKRTGVISTTFIQRKLKIGYARAASIMDQLEEQGVISPPDGSKPRKLLLRSQDLEDEDTYS